MLCYKIVIIELTEHSLYICVFVRMWHTCYIARVERKVTSNIIFYFIMMSLSFRTNLPLKSGSQLPKLSANTEALRLP